MDYSFSAAEKVPRSQPLQCGLAGLCLLRSKVSRCVFPFRLVFLFFVTILSSCVSTNATMLGTATMHRAAVPVQAVKLYRSADQVPGKYEEIALLHSQGPSTTTNEPQMLESMQKKAAELGANGVILDALTEPSAGAKIAGAFLGYSPERTGKSVAIYVYPPGEAPLSVATETAPDQGSMAPLSAEPPARAIENRLEELNQLRSQNLITSEEYYKKRAEALGEL